MKSNGIEFQKLTNIEYLKKLQVENDVVFRVFQSFLKEKNFDDFLHRLKKAKINPMPSSDDIKFIQIHYLEIKNSFADAPSIPIEKVEPKTIPPKSTSS